MKGFTWVTQHLKLKHVGQYDKFLLTSQTLLVSNEAENTYKWIDWIITENRELHFGEKDRVQIHTKGNLDKISTETLKIRMGAVVEVMEKDLARKLPNKFGVAFDGWSEHGVHYLAVFAVRDFVPNEGCVLLGFSPFEQEDDLSSDQHGLYLTNLVQHYERCVKNVIFLVGDNCSANRKFAREILAFL